VKQASRAVHAGRGGKAGMGARAPLAPDLSTAAVHVYEELDDYDAVARGERPGHYYGRNSNRNRAMLEAAVAELEGAHAGVATGSGMSALHLAILALAPKPVTILATRELYGGTLALLRQDLEPAGYEALFVDLNDIDAVRSAMDGAGLVLVETITNPLCRVPDLDAITALARESRVPVLVDNTFATPALFRPLEHGATVVMHSVTKYLGGHSDLVAGVVVGPGVLMDAARARLRSGIDASMPPSAGVSQPSDEWMRWRMYTSSMNRPI